MTTTKKWQVYSDLQKRNVAFAEFGLKVISISSIGALQYPVGDAGDDPKQTCLDAIARCYKDADDHKKHAEGAAALGNKDCEGNHYLAMAESIRLARAIETLVHCCENGIGGRMWPQSLDLN